MGLCKSRALVNDLGLPVPHVHKMKEFWKQTDELVHFKSVSHPPPTFFYTEQKLFIMGIITCIILNIHNEV